jgi:hypothetical protein
MALWILALLVRLTVHDRVPLVAVIYYATPPAVLAVSAGLGAIGLLLARRMRWAAVAAVAGLVCAGWSYHATWFEANPQPQQAALRMMFWNTARGVGGWTALADDVSKADADVIGLVEAGGGGPSFRYALKDWESVDLGAGMFLFSRYRVLHSEAGSLSGGGAFGRAVLDISGKPLTVLVVDINSNPLMFRKSPIEELTRIATEASAGPLIIMGDFNTPADSVFLRGLRNGHRLAFEAAGSGYAATWPVPLPVLTLDQVWVNSQVLLHDCRLGWPERSDHRPVMTDISLLPSARSATPVDNALR